MSLALARSEASLEDRWTAREGWFYMTGMQALVRLPIQQRLRDAAAGLNTGGYISGYRGSPMGRYDIELWRADPIFRRLNIVFRPGLNEDLAATAIWGAACHELPRLRRSRAYSGSGTAKGRASIDPATSCGTPTSLGPRPRAAARACRRRPWRKVFDGGQFFRHLLRRRRHAGPLSIEHPGVDRLRPAWHRDVALLGLLGRHEGGHRRG